MLEATAVSEVGRITHGCLGLYSDANEIAMARLLSFMRSICPSKIGIQLSHAGRKAAVRLPWAGVKPYRSGSSPLDQSEAWTTVAPSSLAYQEGWHVPEALSLEGIEEIKQQFVDAAVRAVRLGLDLIELHAAHGYLMHQFFSPLTNTRTDAYGGSLENRMRLTLEIVSAVRAVMPDTMPLAVRLSAVDWVEGGIELDDSVQLCRRLRDLGCDLMDVSSGGLSPLQKIPLSPGYQVPLAKTIKQETNFPVMTVGLITEARHAEDILTKGEADLIALGRAFLTNPRWPWDAAKELGTQAFYASPYERLQPKQEV
ncbi:MAG: oxidoreductase [Polaromonas sp.]|nr:oxidoreductase [Polaromonas sp.]